MNGKIIVFINPDDRAAHKASANSSIYPNLGVLTLMSALAATINKQEFSLAYLDGTLLGNQAIFKFLEHNAARVSVVCASVLTSNYGAALEAFAVVKSKNAEAVAILGNDHFSALYPQIMANRTIVDYGFAGNDVVLGFASFVSDLLCGKLAALNKYAGLVYRDQNGQIVRNDEDTTENMRLPFVDYSLMDTPFNHRARYFEGQQSTYSFMRRLSLRSMVVDIGRGCIKFSGARLNNIPESACDFCAIIPGSKAIAPLSAQRSWKVLENCFSAGFNYFYITADELPLTFWPTLREMVANPPAWFSSLPESERPKMFGYTRAEAFVRTPERIDALVNKLGFNHFFIGFDGLSDISLKVMNKQPVGREEHNLMWHNMAALNGAAEKNCLITGGIVLTHLGITRDILEANYLALQNSVDKFPKAFAALDFGPLCPIPGSQAFEYLRNPNLAEQRAQNFGLHVNRKFLDSVSHRYQTTDLFKMDELIHDFVAGCCPDIQMDDVNEYIHKTTELAKKYDIVIGGGV